MSWELSESSPALVGIQPRDITTRYGRGRLRRYNGQPCIYCGVTMVVGSSQGRSPSRDHLVPQCRGGPNHRYNIVVCCFDCNGDKGPLDSEEYVAVRAGLASRLDRRPFGLSKGRWKMGTLKVYRGVMAMPYRDHAQIRQRWCPIMKACGS